MGSALGQRDSNKRLAEEAGWGEPLVSTQHKQSLEVGQRVAIAFTHSCMKMSPHIEVIFWFIYPEYFVHYPLV